LQGADAGDTTTIIETAIAAAEQIEDAQADVTEPQTLDEIIADKGYHSNQTMVDLDAVGLRSYIAEPDRGRPDWSGAPAAQAPVYGNRRRIRGLRGRRLMRRRGELIERSFAHLYDTGGVRRTHLRGHTNILKRLLIHAGGFNLGLLLRTLPRCGDAAWSPGLRRPRRCRSFRPDPHRPRTAYCQSRQLVLSFGFARFESLTFAVTLCVNRNHDLYHGLLGCIRSEHCLAATLCMPCFPQIVAFRCIDTNRLMTPGTLGFKLGSKISQIISWPFFDQVFDFVGR